MHSATTRFTSRISEPRVEKTLHSSSNLPVLVKISLKKFVERRELYFEIWHPAHFMSLVINSKHCSVTNELCLIRVSICEYKLNFIIVLNLSKSKFLTKFYLYSSVLG